MAEIKTHSNLPHIPDDISLPHFMLEYHHPLRPTRTDVACLIEDTSGRKIYLEEVLLFHGSLYTIDIRSLS